MCVYVCMHIYTRTHNHIRRRGPTFMCLCKPVSCKACSTTERTQEGTTALLYNHSDRKLGHTASGTAQSHPALRAAWQMTRVQRLQHSVLYSYFLLCILNVDSTLLCSLFLYRERDGSKYVLCVLLITFVYFIV